MKPAAYQQLEFNNEIIDDLKIVQDIFILKYQIQQKTKVERGEKIREGVQFLILDMLLLHNNAFTNSFGRHEG